MKKRRCLKCGAPVEVDWTERSLSFCDTHHAEREQVIAEIAAAEKAALEAIGTIRIAAQKYHDYAHYIGTSALTHIATISSYESKFVWSKAIERADRRKAEQQSVEDGFEIPF